MIRMLKQQGYTIVMVEQNFRFAAPLADRFYVMEHGTIVQSFGKSELDSNMGMLHDTLGYKSRRDRFRRRPIHRRSAPSTHGRLMPAQATRTGDTA